MKEQLVTYKTAKLAKEVGFGDDPYILLHSYYEGKNKLTREPTASKRIKRGTPIHGQLQLSSVEVWVSQGMDNSTEECTLAPTLSLLQKWLRKKYNTHVEVNVEYNHSTKEVWNDTYIVTIVAEGYHREISIDASFEDALEKGLQESLIKIKQDAGK